MFAFRTEFDVLSKATGAGAVFSATLRCLHRPTKQRTDHLGDPATPLGTFDWLEENIEEKIEKPFMDMRKIAKIMREIFTNVENSILGFDTLN